MAWKYSKTLVLIVVSFVQTYESDLGHDCVRAISVLLCNGLLRYW